MTPPTRLPRQAFPKSARVTRGADFTHVLRRGGVAADDTLVVFALPNDRPYCRLGVTIPKKVGNAVVRNRWKRLIRESFRTQRASLPGGYDIVVRPKKGSQAIHAKIRKGLPKLIAKAIRRV